MSVGRCMNLVIWVHCSNSLFCKKMHVPPYACNGASKPIIHAMNNDTVTDVLLSGTTNTLLPPNTYIVQIDTASDFYHHDQWEITKPQSRTVKRVACPKHAPIVHVPSTALRISL